jgi:steroid 5-alpha reductase family enzyme
MRKKHGNSFWWVSLFTVFGLQALLLWVISLVVQIGHNTIHLSIIIFDFLMLALPLR